ncbi:hypothetical protein IQ26_07748, partial [Mesorhizobium tianshanense]
MKRSRFSEEQIIGILKEHEAIGFRCKVLSGQRICQSGGNHAAARISNCSA